MNDAKGISSIFDFGASIVSVDGLELENTVSSVFFLTEGTELTVTNSNFKGLACSARDSGCFLTSSDSTMIMDSVTITDVTSTSNVGTMSLTNSELTITNCKFENLISKEKAGCMFADRSKIVVKN